MSRLVSVDDWKEVDWNSKPDGSWTTMMARVAAFHSKHDFANPENNGHDMGYRVALTVEELGEFAAAITKGKPKEEASEELADLLALERKAGEIFKNRISSLSYDLQETSKTKEKLE